MGWSCDRDRILAFLAGVLLAWTAPSCEPRPEEPTPSRASTASKLAERRKELDRTVWSREILAQKYERTFTALWDGLLKAKDENDKYEVLRRFPFRTLFVGSPQTPSLLERGIRETRFAAPERETSRDEWSRFLEDFRKKGNRLVQSEWHHVGFETRPGTSPRSTVRMILHGRNEARSLRMTLEGSLRVEWSGDRDRSGRFKPGTIRVEDLVLTERWGKPYFTERLQMKSREAPGGSEGLQPLIVYDLDGNGLAEIILGGMNRVWWNRGGGKFEWEPLLKYPVRMYKPGVIADFTGDGRADFVCVSRDNTARLYVADVRGRFSKPTRRLWPGRLNFPSVLTAGDIDNDGDLDLWLAQYEPPYQGGQMPTPYYDANDGHPAYLLRNEGDGRFVDITEEAGLGKKRFRRTYSSSLVDLNDDGHLDLLVVSDFAGVDIYVNDGAGSFRDVTRELVRQPHIFGMAHTFGDYDLDGTTDFYVIGMSSTTATRLESMELTHPEFPEHDRMRPPMSFGNRMYLSRGRRFEEPGFRDQVARTGWSWGTTTFDFDSDGDLDLYVANGHRSGASTRDYCTRFWCHDIYTESSQPDSALADLFTKEIAPLVRLDFSWDGYQHNALLMNREGKGFREVAHLMDVAFEFDARGVVSDDLDGDGKVDLLVVEQIWKPVSQVLHVLENRCPESNHWIGVRLREEGGGISPVGARITVKSPAFTRVERIVTGDSFYSQHACSKHFGLGKTDQVEWIEVVWHGGRRKKINNPEINRYHDIRARP